EIVRRHHHIRRDSDADRRGHRQEAGVADRRRAGSQRQGRQDLDHLAARARAREQEERRHRRGGHARRRQGLRNQKGGLAVVALRRRGSATSDMNQDIRFCTTTDGVRLAYGVSGKGPPLVMPATWLSHLKHQWTSLAWRHWLETLSQ